MKIVGVCGFGYTGSGAVIDLLKGRTEIEVIDKLEFTIPYTPDGLDDLRYHIMENPTRFFGCDTAIRRYIRFVDAMDKRYSIRMKGSLSELTDDYLNKIIQTKWKGNCGSHYVQAGGRFSRGIFITLRRVRRVLERWINLRHTYPEKEMYLSIGVEDFDKITQEYVSKIINSMRVGNQNIVVLDQAFCANNPKKSFRYFENPCAIIVDRDPRDLYILAKKYLKLNGSFIPSDNAHDFIVYYKQMRRNMCETDKDILNIQFENLIYDYEKTKHEILSFIGVQDDESIVTNFKPEESKKNTRLFLKHPEYMEDIKIIEAELAEWLYPFPEEVNA